MKTMVSRRGAIGAPGWNAGCSTRASAFWLLTSSVMLTSLRRASMLS